MLIRTVIREIALHSGDEMKTSWFYICPLLLCANVAQASVYLSYDGLSDVDGDPAGIGIDQDKRIMWIGHAGREMTLCDDSSPYFCFEGPALRFFVPKERAMTVGQAWAGGGVSFEIVGTSAVGALGIVVECFVISSTQGDDVIRFYYSQEKGLVGMNFRNVVNGEQFFYLVQGSRGFPHD